MHTHEHYEELCALAATGQVEDCELSDFKAHLSSCEQCRALVHEFAEIGASVISSKARRSGNRDVPAGMTERFIARARSQGIPIDSQAVVPARRRPLRPWTAAIAAAAVVFLGAFLVVSSVVRHDGKNTPAVTRLQSQANVAQPSPPASAEQPAALDRVAARQNDAARAQIARLYAKLKTNRDALDRANQETKRLSARLAALEQENGALEARDKDRSADFANLQAQLDKLNAERVADEVAVLSGENEVRDLRKTLAAKEAKLQEQQHLVSVGSQVRDLIVARNLHIIDVYDRDGEGNQQRPFGRIFYTEGKSLVFYAYDLADPRKLDKEISFYAWGASLGGRQPVKRLGIFHNEDVNEGRWVLSFDDSQVLAKIDSVFVTAEKDNKPISRPNGKEILYGFLGTKPNHP